MGQADHESLATEDDCGDLSFSATGLPSGLSLTDNGDCTATVSGTISAEAGSYPVTYSVTDALDPSDSATGSFKIRPLYTFNGFFSPLDNPLPLSRQGRKRRPGEVLFGRRLRTRRGRGRSPPTQALHWTASRRR
jgi:hypothetical protein